MRRILVLSWILVLLDMLFFAILSPLLPGYVDRLGLSDTEAGVLSSAYAWGAFLAALPSGFLAQRLGPRRLNCWSLLALCMATVAFGWARDIVVLDLARFAQGLCGAAIWSGAMTWLVAVAPIERKGAAIGTAAGAGGLGALLGPAVGAIAVAAGPEVLFTGVAVILLVVCAAVAMTASTSHVPKLQSVRTVASAAVRGPLVKAFLFIAVPTLAFGLMNVLAPLKMSGLGGSAALIAGSFIASAAIEGLLGPLSGHWSDLFGRRAVYLAGLVIFCGGLALMATTDSLATAVVVPPLCSVGGGLYITAAFAHFSDAAEDAELAQSHAFALSTSAFALGLAAGSSFGGAFAGIGGGDAPFFVLIVALVGLAVYTKRGWARTPRIRIT